MIEVTKREQDRIVKLVAEYLSEKCNIITEEDRKTASIYFIGHPELWRDNND